MSETSVNISKFPDEVVSQERKSIAILQLRNELKSIQFNYNVIKDIVTREGLGEIPPIKNITHHWATRIIKERKTAVFQSPIFTNEQRTATIQKWEDIEKQLLIPCKNIEGAVARCPENSLTLDPSTGNYTIEDIDLVAEKEATLPVPEDAAIHWQLIEAVRQAIANLRKWEKKHDLLKRPLIELVKYTNICEQAQRWATGSVFCNHQYEDAYMTACREVNETDRL